MAMRVDVVLFPNYFSLHTQLFRLFPSAATPRYLMMHTLKTFEEEI